ncbi:MAG: PAS domain S-box protein [Deltaproteobacteria bacterium]|nr:PAS domain S-box protein [Deltaproteobacteria bacterium]
MTLTDREWIYKQIVDFAQDGILFADQDGNIQLWNSGAETIFGYTSEEAIGKSLDLIVPEKLREQHWKGYLRVMETGESRYGSELLKVPAIRKDGSTISVEFTILLVRNHQNEIIGTVAILRDVTEGWKQEKELKQKIKFLEDQLK